MDATKKILRAMRKGNIEINLNQNFGDIHTATWTFRMFISSYKDKQRYYNIKVKVEDRWNPPTLNNGEIKHEETVMIEESPGCGYIYPVEEIFKYMPLPIGAIDNEITMNLMAMRGQVKFTEEQKAACLKYWQGACAEFTKAYYPNLDAE